MRAVSKLLLAAAMAAVLSTVTGCASIFASTKPDIDVQISGVDLDTEVSVTTQSGRRVRTYDGAVRIPFDRTADNRLRVSAEGYEDREVVISRSINGWFWANLLLSYFFFVGMLSDFANGSMWDPALQQVNVDLRPIRKERIATRSRKDEPPVTTRKRTEEEPELAPRPASATRERPADEPAEASSAVDFVPSRGAPDRNAYALIVGIERYGGDQIPVVDYAARDAKTFRNYATKILGVPADQVILVVDQAATKGGIQTALSGKLKNLLVNHSEARVFVYFAGHGVPDVRTGVPFLVPYDGDPNYPEISCLTLKYIYDSLASLRARSVTIFLDSCFSGGSGRGEAPRTLLAGARPMGVVSKNPLIPPGVTVLAGANGQQLTSGLRSEQHGLFTFYVMKGLQGDADDDNDGTVSLRELSGYVSENVARKARIMNREQTPVLLGDSRDRPLTPRR